jgi:hypothetical protein
MQIVRRAAGCRWGVPDDMKLKVLLRLDAALDDPDPRTKMAACKTIAFIDKIDQDQEKIDHNRGGGDALEDLVIQAADALKRRLAERATGRPALGHEG